VNDHSVKLTGTLKILGKYFPTPMYYPRYQLKRTGLEFKINEKEVA
jgi:hypothetical protein